MDEFELCPKVEKTMNLLSKRWNALILYQLMAGPQRFCTMTDKLGVSGKTLTDKLKELEKAGYVIRQVYPETPVRIEYSLTEKGLSLAPVMNEIESWSKKWMEMAGAKDV